MRLGLQLALHVWYIMGFLGALKNEVQKGLATLEALGPS